MKSNELNLISCVYPSDNEGKEIYLTII